MAIDTRTYVDPSVEEVCRKLADEMKAYLSDLNEQLNETKERAENE